VLERNGRSVRRLLLVLTGAILLGAILLFPGSLAARPGAAPPPAPFLAEQPPATGSATAAATAAATVPSGFSDDVVLSGLTNPTAVRFASDGRIFVAEKSGLLKVFDSLADTTPTVVVDLRTEVDDYWDRGLLGLALDPNFPTAPYVYLLYAYDGAPGMTAPQWNDACPSPPGPTTDGCTVTGKLVRIQLSGDVITGSPQVLLANQWCQQFPSHSIGDLHFGPDGYLYVSGGDGASFNYADYGQSGGSSGSPTPANPCGDPPGAVGTALSPPTAEGGALRSQSVRRAAGEPVATNGAVLRLDPTTGAAAPGNPNGAASDANAKRIVAYGFRNPFRFTFRPGTSELWVGDVGWDTWEEVDRVVSPTASLTNFGWPCYEGGSPQSGYQSAGLNLCSSLYSGGGATAPYYTYNHSSAVVTNDGCPTANGSSITGTAFYTSGSYPAAYNGALFFADHTRNCIWAMLAGSNGLPDPTNRQLLVGGAGHPVDLETGPGGDLFYVDMEDGTIHRLTYSGGGGGGTCSAGQFHAQYFNNMTLSGTPVLDRCEASVNYNWGGGSPTGVNADGFSASWDGSFDFSAGTYTFTATADDGIRVKVDGTTVIDGWKDQSATTYTAPVTLTAGTHQVRIEYYENTGDAVAQVSWQLDSSGGGGTCSGQFDAQYFNNQTLTGTPVVDRCESAINNNWGQGSPAAGVNSDHFSARWTGSFSFAAGGYAFTATADDGIRVYVDGSLLIDEWVDTGATTYNATTTLTAGTHTVTVEYYENTGDAVAALSWQQTSGPPPPPGNTAPTAVIDSPASSLTWAVGDSISFSGHATDTEDGTLPASSLTWTLIIHHCPTPSSCHDHTVQSWSGVSSGTFGAPDHEYPASLQLQLTATDSGGLKSTATVDLQPKTVVLSFASSPSGLTLTVGSTSSVAPFTRTVIVNSSNSISAGTPQTLNGTSYSFSSWSDGGAATHNITAPASAATYTATYTAQVTSSPPTNTALPTITGTPRVGRTLQVSNGSWNGSQPITYTYQWLQCDRNGNSCVAIGGATSSTYVVRSADLYRKLRARVTAKNALGSASATSGPTSTISR